MARRNSEGKDPRWDLNYGPRLGKGTGKGDDRPGFGPRIPPPWIRDRAAEHKLWQGWKDHETCPKCNLRLPRSGECDCS